MDYKAYLREQKTKIDAINCDVIEKCKTLLAENGNTSKDDRCDIFVHVDGWIMGGVWVANGKIYSICCGDITEIGHRLSLDWCGVMLDIIEQTENKKKKV